MQLILLFIDLIQLFLIDKVLMKFTYIENLISLMRYFSNRYIIQVEIRFVENFLLLSIIIIYNHNI